MDYRLTLEQERLRDEVQRFLGEDPAIRARSPREDGWINGFDREFSRRLAGRGWIGMTWPKRYGGAERTYLDRLVVTEELLRAGAPVAAHWFGDRQIGPALLAHGSEEQRAALVPRIARGEISFCVGMSEPGAGSDLASLATRADPRGGEFVVRGQKIWTSFASEAEYCYLVARTDPDSRPHRGISEFLLPMDTPGITVRPIRDMVGETHFGEVFFDDVRVPASCLIGELNRGWYQIMEQLDYERSGIERLLSNWPLWDEVVRIARATGGSADAGLRQRIADVETRLCCGRWMVYRVAAMLTEGRVPNHEAAVAKTFCTSLEQQISRLAAEMLGPTATLLAGSARASLRGRAARSLLYAPAYTIQGGTNEILRNIIARRGLGLPD